MVEDHPLPWLAPLLNGVEHANFFETRATEYSKGKMARDGGATWQYINATATTGNAPPVLPTESNSYWQLVAQDGANGAGLVDSVNGKTGAAVLFADDIEVSGIAAAPASTTPIPAPIAASRAAM